jgi:alpha-amylase
MATEIVVYMVVHQPRRLKLPAQPVPCGASSDDIIHCVFDEAMNERYFRYVAERCYYPAAETFLRLARNGMKLSIGFSLSWVYQAEQWDRSLLALFQELIAEPNVELIGVEPYHSFLFLFDLPLFVQRMRWMREELTRIFGKRPRVTDTTEMCMSACLYDAIAEAGFEAGMLDGRGWVMEWREPTHLYHYDGAPRLFCRHLDLSDDVGYRFSNRTWSGFPLYAEQYADWLRHTWGDFVFIGWDFETFGEHHRYHSGIFDFIQHLPHELHQRGASFLTPGEALDHFGAQAYQLPLPIFPTTWAGSGGMDFFLGNSAQQAIFQLMLATFGVASLTEDPKLLDLALWMAQSDNLHLIQWFGRSGSQAEVSAYFTPREWWDLGPERIIVEQQNVYRNVIRAMERHLPAQRTHDTLALPAATIALRSRGAKRLATQPAPHERELLGIERY